MQWHGCQAAVACVAVVFALLCELASPVAGVDVDGQQRALKNLNLPPLPPLKGFPPLPVLPPLGTLPPLSDISVTVNIGRKLKQTNVQVPGIATVQQGDQGLQVGVPGILGVSISPAQAPGNDLNVNVSGLVGVQQTPEGTSVNVLGISINSGTVSPSPPPPTALLPPVLLASPPPVAVLLPQQEQQPQITVQAPSIQRLEASQGPALAPRAVSIAPVAGVVTAAGGRRLLTGTR